MNTDVIEIYEKATGNVEKTVTLTSDRALRGFLRYFDMQCDTKNYAWRFKV